MTALLHVLANLARLRWLGAAFCALAIVCTTANANAIAPGTENEQTKTRVGGFEQNSPLNVCANALASAETHRGISSAPCETASAFSHAAEGAAVGETAVTRFVSGVDVMSRGQVVASGTVDLGPTLESIESGAITARDIFMNREALLPLQSPGYYQEFVVPTPGLSGVGPQRIVQGLGGELFYTPDHYLNFIPLN